MEKNKFLILYWEKEFFSLAEFATSRKGTFHLLREVTEYFSQADENKVTLSTEALHEEITRLLKKTLSSWKISKPLVHCVLPASEIFLQKITLRLPPNLDDAIPSLIELEAKEVIPWPLEEVVWDHQLFPSLDKESFEVAYVAVKIKFLESLCEAISKAGLEIQTVQAAPSVLENLPEKETGSEFLETKRILLGAAYSLQETAPFKINLLPPSLVAAKNQRRNRTYLVATVAFLALTFLLWSFYFRHETKRIIAATATATLLLEQEEKSLAESEKALTNFQKVQECSDSLTSLLEARAAWPQLINELHKSIPSRYIWITKLSPSVEEKSKPAPSSPQKKNKKGATPAKDSTHLKEASLPDGTITSIVLEGLYLENPRQADVVDDFVAQLKKSHFFALSDKKNCVTLRCIPDGTAYAYPFKLLLPLRKPIKPLE